MRWLVLIAAAACDGGGMPAVDAAPGAITLSAPGLSLDVTDFGWGANNDCPAGGGGAVPVTIRATAPGGGVGLCLPHPDLVGSAPLDLGDEGVVRDFSAGGQAGGCSATKTTGAKPSGTVRFAGFSTSAGATYQMTISGQVDGVASCADAGHVTIQLSGTALVTPR